MSRYNAEISAGSLMLPESRRVARFILTQPDRATWFDTLRTENILQKKTPATARRQATLIRKRLNTLDAAEVRSRAMGRALKAVEALPQDKASALLPLDPSDANEA